MNRTRSNRIDAAKITFTWTIAGLFMFLFELMFRVSHDLREGAIVTGFMYIVPPLVFGYPFARLQIKLENMAATFSLKAMIMIKVGLYFTGILLIYHLISRVVTALNLDMMLGRYLEIKFLVVWGYFLLLFLALRHVFSHFDGKTISSWLLGEFYRPTQEERIFLFMDLNGSTHIAEKIGSETYFHFLNDFHDIVEKYVSRHKGEIFQYVGDEVVISWKANEVFEQHNIVDFFFKVYTELMAKGPSFIEKYGHKLAIKGALHIGEVTKGELGKRKKDFVFVGDVLNTTSRMYKLGIKEHGPLVVSDKLIKRLGDLKRYEKLSLGEFKLEGKSDEIHMYALNLKSISK